MRSDALAGTPSRPLRGCTVVTTRERPGRLDSDLAAVGADVVHVPLIETTDPADGGTALRVELERLDHYDWVVVTSPVGAERVMPAVRDTRSHDLRVATVGTRTAEVATQLSGRRVDIVPDRQLAVELVAAMPEPVGRATLLLAVADRADPATADALRARGYDVTSVVAYRTLIRRPSGRERRAALAADVAVFASGSAAASWADAFGTETPRSVVSIGPTTTAAATARGLHVTATATDHSIRGLVETVIRTVAGRP